MTQLMVHRSSFQMGKKTSGMTRSVYWKEISPIAFLFSLSLTSGNNAYLYLNVPSIQMLKVRQDPIYSRLLAKIDL
jgi:hypothetical protein